MRDDLYSFDEFMTEICVAGSDFVWTTEATQRIAWSLTQFDDEQLLEAWRHILHYSNENLYLSVGTILGNMDSGSIEWIAEHYPNPKTEPEDPDFAPGDLVVYKPDFSFWKKLDNDFNHDVWFYRSNLWWYEECFTGPEFSIKEFIRTPDRPMDKEEVNKRWQERLPYLKRLERLGRMLLPKYKGRQISSFESILVNKSDSQSLQPFHPFATIWPDETDFEWPFGMVVEVIQLPDEEKFLPAYRGDTIYRVLFGEKEFFCPAKRKLLRHPKFSTIDEMPRRLKFWDVDLYNKINNP